MLAFLATFAIVIHLISCPKYQKIFGEKVELLSSDSDPEESQDDLEIPKFKDAHKTEEIYREPSDDGETHDISISSESSTLTSLSSEHSDKLHKLIDSPSEYQLLEQIFTANMMLWKRFLSSNRLTFEYLLDGFKSHVKIFGNYAFYVHCFLFSKGTNNDDRLAFNNLVKELKESFYQQVPSDLASFSVTVHYTGILVTFNHFNAINSLLFLTKFRDGQLFHKILLNMDHCPPYQSTELTRILEPTYSIQMIQKCCHRCFLENDCRKIEEISLKNIESAKTTIDLTPTQTFNQYSYRIVDYFIYGMSYALQQTGDKIPAKRSRERNMKYLMDNPTLRKELMKRVEHQSDSHSKTESEEDIFMRKRVRFAEDDESSRSGLDNSPSSSST